MSFVAFEGPTSVGVRELKKVPVPEEEAEISELIPGSKLPKISYSRGQHKITK
jgi:hypothetical protein